MSDRRPLRYEDEGNVHLDFHGATNTTIEFIVERFGVEALHAIFERVGKDVYADLRRHLLDGDADELVRHWHHYFGRENADFEITVEADGTIVLTVRRCPAYEHARQLAGAVSPHFCDQTTVTNNAMADGTPFSITTEITGEGSCRQIVRRRRR
ncbi:MULTISPECIES: hypothetical protein [unclassified Roseitalea]|uniref:hypothetical protein n=1 Tax=unclassified Roseitalea TaxID=2639107 RepID=UPI00273D5545|nr:MULTISPECIES: hypothetical protein [unclassified Roseitalea]